MEGTEDRFVKEHEEEKTDPQTNTLTYDLVADCCSELSHWFDPVGISLRTIKRN